MQAAMAMNVLDDDDGIVDQNADREDQGEERDAIERKSIGPGSEQRRRQRDDHGHADHGSLASAHRKHHEQYHRDRSEEQLLHQRLRFVVGGRTVVARHRHLDVVGHVATTQQVDALDDFARHVDGVLTGLLGDRQGHSRCIANRLARKARAGTHPDVVARLIGTTSQRGHLAKINRLTGGEADNQISDGRRIRKEGADLNWL